MGGSHRPWHRTPRTRRPAVAAGEGEPQPVDGCLPPRSVRQHAQLCGACARRAPNRAPTHQTPAHMPWGRTQRYPGFVSLWRQWCLAVTSSFAFSLLELRHSRQFASTCARLDKQTQERKRRMDNPVKIDRLRTIADPSLSVGSTVHDSIVETALASIAFDLRRIADCAEGTNASLKEIGEQLTSIDRRLWRLDK